MRAKIEGCRSVRGRSAFLTFITLLLMCAAPEKAEAEKMIPRDASNPYQQNPHAKLRHVLLYDNAPAHAMGRAALRASLARLAHRYGFRLDTSAAPIGYVQPSVLEGVDVLILAHNDQNVLGPEGSASTAAVESFIYEQGKSLLMVHAAGAFLTCYDSSRYRGPTGGGGPQPPDVCVFMARAIAQQYSHHIPAGSPARIYVDSVKAGEIPPHASLGGNVPTPPASQYSHGISNPETRNIFTGLPRVAESLKDEWWMFQKSPRLFGDSIYTVATLDSDYVEGRVNVLLSLDEASVDWGDFRMGDHPVAWTRKMGNGLVGFNSAGHDSMSNVYTQADSMMEKFNGRLLRYLARDFVGCMDSASAEYNPEATVEGLTDSDPDDPCAGPSAVNSPGGVSPDVSVAASAGVIHISWENPGRYDLRIVDVTGKAVTSLSVREERKVVTITSLKPGIYFVNVTGGDGTRFARRVTVF